MMDSGSYGENRAARSDDSPTCAEKAAIVCLRLKSFPRLALEADVISPDIIGGLSRPEIDSLPVRLGRRRYRLCDFFETDGEKSRRLELHGDCSRVKLIGRGMTGGSVTVFGNAGMHLGAEMRGGAITVHGNVADWTGAEMRNGLIHVRGAAGGQAGAAYRGSRKGMRGGMIVVEGDADIEIGMRMRRGLIYIGGRAGDFAGLQMMGGTILLCGGAGLRTGAWMSRGTIVALKPVDLLPTFPYACAYEPVFLRLLLKHLADFGITPPDNFPNGPLRRHTGDTSGLGKGEILTVSSSAV
ncbi:MAG TPA: formylmethanofuran dehydrogenase subunit C [Acidobacteriota bacterium]|nr:formylmethanofuran dehydrogenase subunit C [Acidobacteriota bacterium]